MPGRALEGLRVIEFTDEIGSYCGRLLADLGAECIKVEPPGGGRQRHTPPFIASRPESVDSSLSFWIHNTSKKSVTLDLDSLEGQRKAANLIAGAGVVIEDYPVGYLDARGLGFDASIANNSRLVYASITGFGQTGPHAHFAYSDIVGQAMGGIMTLAGEPTEPPFMIYGNQSNISASIQASQAIMAALLYADATGEGQRIDVSAQESLSFSQETAIQTWDLQKRNRVRTGERRFPQIKTPGLGLMRCTDGFVYIMTLTGAGGGFAGMLKWLRHAGGIEDLDDEPYASFCQTYSLASLTAMMTDAGALARLVPLVDHVQDVLERFFASMSTRQAYEDGQMRQVLVGQVSTPKDLAHNTQLRARNWFVHLPFEDGAVEFPGAPYNLSVTPAVIGRPPRLGEHNAEVLAAAGERL